MNQQTRRAHLIQQILDKSVRCQTNGEGPYKLRVGLYLSHAQRHEFLQFFQRHVQDFVVQWKYP
jgi:hypothetical protein